MAKEEVLSKIIPVFRRYGYEGATVSRLSAATGLKKASLYHYFQGGKEQMAEAVLAEIGRWVNENIFQPLQTADDPQVGILEMIQGLEEFYDQGQTPCVLAVMSVGGADDLFHNHLQQSLGRWLLELSQIVEATGVSPQEARIRAEDAMILIQGALVLNRLSPNNQTFSRTLAKLPQILLGDAA